MSIKFGRTYHIYRLDRRARRRIDDGEQASCRYIAKDVFQGLQGAVELCTTLGDVGEAPLGIGVTEPGRPITVFEA